MPIHAQNPSQLWWKQCKVLGLPPCHFKWPWKRHRISACSFMPEQHRSISLALFHFTSTPQLFLICPKILHSISRSGICSHSTRHYRNSDLLQGESSNFYIMICCIQQFYIKVLKIFLSGIPVNIYLPSSDSKGRVKNFPYALWCHKTQRMPSHIVQLWQQCKTLLQNIHLFTFFIDLHMLYITWKHYFQVFQYIFSQPL